MKRWLSLVAGAGLLLVSCETESRIPTEQSDAHPANAPVLSQEPGSTIHVFPQRGPRTPLPSGLLLSPPSLGSPTIAYHGGPIITTQKVQAIYWASRPIYAGGPTPGTTGAGSGDGSLIGFFLNHIGGSSYYGINTTYYDGSNNHVQNTVTYTRYWASNTGVPAAGASVSDAAVRQKILDGISSGALTWDPNTVYTVFSDSGVNLGGNFVPGGYCAYHNFWTQFFPSRVYKYAVMPHDIDIDLQNIPDTWCSKWILDYGSPNADAAADVEVNALAHEIEETNTDPQINAWYDLFNGQKYENADKCWRQFDPYYTTANGSRADMNLGGRDFLVQKNWEYGSLQGCATIFGVATLTLSPNPVSICLNGASPLSAATTDEIGNGWSAGTVGWSSSDPSIATVTSTGSRSGSASGVAAGQATITATLDGVSGQSTANVATCLAPPTNCQLAWIPPPHYLHVTWANSGAAGVSTEVEILKNGGNWTPVATAGPGISDYYYVLGTQTGLFYARVRHVKSGYSPSAYCNTGAVTVS